MTIFVIIQTILLNNLNADSGFEEAHFSTREKSRDYLKKKYPDITQVNSLTDEKYVTSDLQFAYTIKEKPLDPED